MNSEENLIEKQLSSEEIFDGTVLHVFRDEISLPNGNTSVRELIRHVGAVCVLPVDSEGNCFMERQFRYPLGRVITEIPAGKLDSPQEDRLEAAKRELKEETGMTAGKWTFMGYYVPAAAYSDELISMYLAQDLSFGETHLDEDEFLSVMKVPLSEMVRKVMEGEIADGKSQVLILKAARFLQC